MGLPGRHPHTRFLLCPLQAAKLKARLTVMEGWLQGSDCGSSWGPLDILQGEAPREDGYQGHHLPPGTRLRALPSSCALPGEVGGAGGAVQVLNGRCPVVSILAPPLPPRPRHTACQLEANE